MFASNDSSSESDCIQDLDAGHMAPPMRGTRCTVSLIVSAKISRHGTSKAGRQQLESGLVNQNGVSQRKRLANLMIKNGIVMYNRIQ